MNGCKFYAHDSYELFREASFKTVKIAKIGKVPFLNQIDF